MSVWTNVLKGMSMAMQMIDEVQKTVMVKQMLTEFLKTDILCPDCKRKVQQGLEEYARRLKSWQNLKK